MPELGCGEYVYLIVVGVLVHDVEYVGSIFCNGHHHTYNSYTWAGVASPACYAVDSVPCVSVADRYLPLQ